MDGISWVYILQKVKDTSLSLRDICVGDADLELPVCKQWQGRLEKFKYTVDRGSYQGRKELLPQRGIFLLITKIGNPIHI